MGKLCMGTYLMILYKMRASGCKQKELVGTVMNFRSNEYDESDDSQASHIIHGDINPPEKIRKNVNWLMAEELADIEAYFKADVVSILNPNKIQQIKLALIKVIFEDESIEDTTIVNMITKATKEKLQEDNCSIERFLLGIFLYVLQFTDNVGTREFVDEIDNQFFADLDFKKTKKKRLVLKNEYSMADMQKAKEFCIRYEKEIELLPLCQIAVNIDPIHRFVREMYNDFNMCNEETQNLIIEIKGQRKLIFEESDWKCRALSKYEEKLEEYKLSKRDYLYEGGKYFHRAYERYPDFYIDDNNPYIFDGLCKYSMDKKIAVYNKSSIGLYIDDYLWIKKNQPRKRPKKPMDYMWDFLGLKEAPEVGVTFWMCRFIIDTCGYFISPMDYINNRNDNNEMDLRNVTLGDSECMLNTLEDMYLYALLELYKFYYADDKENETNI